MLGTFSGALEARQIETADRITATSRGEVELEDGVLVIKRIHVAFRLRASVERHAAAERAHAVFADRCPVYRSLRRSIEITSSCTILDSGSGVAG